MKKILNLLIIALIAIVLIACDEKPNGITFNYKSEFTHIIGDKKSNYNEGLEVIINEKNVTGLVMIDESKIDYEKLGTYDLIFYVRYESITHERISKVNVVNKSTPDPIEPNPIDPDPIIPSENEVTLNIFYLNDLHGAILEENDSMGLSKIANVVKTEKTKNPEETLFLSGGDMLQGQILSNWYDGSNAIEIFNAMDMDAFVIGNHEFDWGFNEVLKYFNNTYEIQANFKALGANVYQNDTSKMVEGLNEYVMIEKSGIKIAVIGTIGDGLESSISYSRVKDYYFTNSATKTKEVAKHVRDNEDADIVIAINHGSNDSFNESVTRGSDGVDLVFNGHTHYSYIEQSNGKYIMQTKANGEYLGNVQLTYNKEEGKVVNSNASLLNRENTEALNTDEPTIKAMVDGYYNEIKHLYDEILPSSASYSEYQISDYIAKLIQKYTGADAGIHNSGGTRAPINSGESLSYAKLFQIFPFDNTIVLVTVSGSEFRSQTNRNVVFKKEGLGSINNSSNYVIATNDYIFGNSDSLRNSDNIIYTGITLLDILVEAIENQKEAGNTKFNINNTIIFNEPLMLVTDIYQPKTYLSI